MEAEIIAETAKIFKRRLEALQETSIAAPMGDHRKTNALKAIAEVSKRLESFLIVGVNNPELLAKLKNSVAAYKIFDCLLADENNYQSPYLPDENKFNEGFNNFFLKNEQTLFPTNGTTSVKSITDEHETVKDREQEHLIRHFCRQHQDYLRNIKKVNAVELLNNIISSDEQLRLIQKILRQLEDTMTANNQQFAHLFTQFDLIKGQHRHDAIYRDIYSKDVSIGLDASASEFYKVIEIILIESTKSGNMFAVQESLQNLNLDYFADFLNLTLPAHKKSLSPLSSHTTILDFMYNKDFKELISHDSDAGNCKMRGNPNWILMLIFICHKSKTPRSKFKKLLSLIACRDDQDLLDHFKLDLEKFWLHLRSYFNKLVIRKYIVARKIFSGEYLQFEESGEICELFEKSCDTIYNTIFNNEDEESVDIIYQSNFDLFIKNLARSFSRHTSLLSIIELPFFIRKLSAVNRSCHVYDIKNPIEKSLLDVFDRFGLFCDGPFDTLTITLANYLNLLMPYLTPEITTPNQKLVKTFSQNSISLKEMEVRFFFSSFIADVSERIDQFARLISKEKDKTIVREIKRMLPQYFSSSEVDAVLVRTTQASEMDSEIETENAAEQYAQSIRNRMTWLLSDAEHFVSAFDYAFDIFMKDLKNEHFERACFLYNGIIVELVFYQRMHVKNFQSHPKYKQINQKIRVFNDVVDAISSSVILEYELNPKLEHFIKRDPEAAEQNVHAIKVS
jgi:hypothetical protein